MKLHVHGGAQMVTGANYLLELGDQKILIDCGLYQGNRYCDELNFQPFPYRPKEIYAVFVSHAHIDHAGRLPKLKREGFKGKIYSTPPTKDFAELMLLDSEHILGQEAEHLKHPPIYTASDVLKTLKVWEGIPYHERLSFKNFSVTFFDAGHILGSSSILIEHEGKKIVFSGDLGNVPDPLLKPTEIIKTADYCLVESAYGGRIHESKASRKDILREVIESTIKAKGVLMIPAPALERTQEILFELNSLVEENRIPKVPVYLDSPLAINLTSIYKKYENYFNHETLKLIESGDQIFNFSGLHLTLKTEQSKEINDAPNPKIIIAGSGMSHGGRILHHERRYLDDPKSTILFVSYQAMESLGRRILDGEKIVKIFDEEIPINCRVVALGAYSSHADQPQLLDWVRHMRTSLKKVFIVQGEPKESRALSLKIKNELGIETEIPAMNSSHSL